MEKSAVAEHRWEKLPPDPLGGDHSAGPWQRTRAVGEGGPVHPHDIHMTPSEEHFNRDGGLEVPAC